MSVVYYQTPIGTCKITEQDGFISAISILDEAVEPTEPETPVLQLAINQLEEYFAGTRKVFDLPIKQDGTDFQQQVWQCLMQIDYGKTITYTKQSKLMNNPLAIRAIAAANGKNNLWVVVPCHRVIGANGELTGYAGGLWRKKWLLEHEAKITGSGQTSLF
jgi:methylated-DNA-[protein]-cysteine S-methyltransferase